MEYIRFDSLITQERRRMCAGVFVPEDGARSLTDAQLAEERREFLEAAFQDRVKQGPVRWEMIVTIGEPGDFRK